MDLQLAADDGQVAAINCTGQITRQSPDDPFEKLLGSDCYTRRVLLNLKHARFIDSSGLGWLLIAHKRFNENGGRLILHSVPPLIRHPIDLLRLDKVLTIVATEADALALALAQGR